MSPKYARADKRDLEFWATRITATEGKRLRELGKYLVEAGALDKAGKYGLARFALQSLLRTLEAKFGAPDA